MSNWKRQLAISRYYISQWMLHRINIYYFILYLFLAIIFFKLMMLIKSSGIFRKNRVSCKFCLNITSNFYSVFFYLSQTNRNFETYMHVWFEQLKELKQFEILSPDNSLTNGHCLKSAKDHVWWKLLHVAIQFLYDFILQRANLNVSLWIPARFQFFLHLK